MKYNKNLIKILVVLIIFCSGNIFAMSSSDKALLQKAENYFYQTSKNPVFLQKALHLYKTLYTKNKQDTLLSVRYGYALYFKAAYTFDRSNKKFFSQRVSLYSQAIKIAGTNLEEKRKISKNILSESLLVVGLSEAEISAIKRSAISLFRGRKYLLKALSLSANVQNGAIFLALGRMYAKTPRFLFGDTKIALQYLKNAQKLENIVAFLYISDALTDNKYLHLDKNLKKKVTDILKKGMAISKTRKITLEENYAINSKNIGIKARLKILSSY